MKHNGYQFSMAVDCQIIGRLIASFLGEGIIDEALLKDASDNVELTAIGGDMQVIIDHLNVIAHWLGDAWLYTVYSEDKEFNSKLLEWVVLHDWVVILE